ncbi:hypothetical protein ACCS83_36845, partial [Rhizobium johnstonii]
PVDQPARFSQPSRRFARQICKTLESPDAPLASHGEAVRPVGRASFRQGKGDRLGRTKGYALHQSPLP